MKLLIRGAELDGGPICDVRIRGGVVAEIAHRLDLSTGETIVEAAGGALLPGLRDHHLHLFAMAAALRSVGCGPPAVATKAELVAAVRGAPGEGWIRGVGYHESVAGPLDRWALDEIEPVRPVRIQHRSGALWMLNSSAATAVGAVEEDGRLWRRDAWLRPRVPAEPLDLAAVGRQLAAMGITGVTDATPDLDTDAVTTIAAAVEAGDLPAEVQLLGAPFGVDPAEVAVGRLRVGPWKILLHDHGLPDFDEVVERVRVARRAGRAVAVHCVTREALVLTLTVLDEVGAMPGDRIEHGAVMPPDLVALTKRHGVQVVTQPGFVVDRADQYLAEVDADDRDHLYPYASLLDAGIPTAPSSDAPFGDLDPWRTIEAAGGRLIGEHERVDAAIVLAGYLSPLDDPGGRPRQVTEGATADLVLLDRPLCDALAKPSRDNVRLTLQGRDVTRVLYDAGHG